MTRLMLAGSILGAALICTPLGAQNKDTANANTNANKDTIMNVTGCLAQGDSKNEYMIKDDSGKSFGLRAETGVDLKAHVGHKVTVTGSPMKSKERVKAGQTEENEHLRVSNLSMVSKSCP
jgi:hypothetical protein